MKLKAPIKRDRRKSATHGTYTGSLKDKIAVIINTRLTVFVNSVKDIARVKKKYADLELASQKDIATYSHHNKPQPSAADKAKWKKKADQRSAKRKAMMF